ncbi:MAG: ORF6N domain-containing protein [Clostridia bacterium]|nr:ORF6N domain-containing protein [Clostridia bacterium]
MENENNSIVPINEELDVMTYEVENIKNLIYTIRGKQVILDSDVAMLYKTETRKINQTVKRNIERFPEKFCFKLLEQEFENLKSQFVTSSLKNENLYGGRRKLPLVFTEQGIAMLSGLLRNEVAIGVSIKIMDAFVEMRKFIANNANIFNLSTRVENKFLEYDRKFDIVFDELQNKKETEFKQKIFFNGQIYDSYSLIIDIIKRAKSKILIIDNYIDDSILKILSKKNKDVEVVILSSQNCNLNKLDISKFNKQYPTLKISYTNKFHDRFIVIDNKELYHSGASLKDLGKKCFAISKIEDNEYIEKFNKI